MRAESRRREDVEFELSGKKILPLNSFIGGKKICRSNSFRKECGGSCSVERIFIRRVCFETLQLIEEDRYDMDFWSKSKSIAAK